MTSPWRFCASFFDRTACKVLGMVWNFSNSRMKPVTLMPVVMTAMPLLMPALSAAQIAVADLPVPCSFWMNEEADGGHPSSVFDLIVVEFFRHR